MAKQQEQDNTVCRNRRATHRYRIEEKIECGIILTGTEVKSLRESNASIAESFARLDGSELWLIGAHIATYRFGHAGSHEPYRRRKLLVHKRELNKLSHRVDQKGYTLIPLAVYFNERGLAKVTLGIAIGKSHSDKRQDLKKRDAKREMDRAMRSNR